MTDPEPLTGRRRWHVTAAETGGRLARAEHWAPAGSGTGAPHVHDSEERLEVLAGAVDAHIGDRVLTLAAGDAVCVPAGVAHSWTAGTDAHLFLEWVEA